MKTRKPSFDREKQLWDKNLTVFGIDEVGRGSFAGPLVAAAVSFKSNLKYKWLREINDSKLLTHNKRKSLSKLIRANSKYFTEVIDIKTIDRIGIGKSNALIFKRLIKQTQNEYKNTYFLIDGRRNLKGKNTEFIVKGDCKSISVAAASIIAKVYRDNLMKDLGKKFPGYNFSKNKGYGTEFHQKALKRMGLSKVHRKSFRLQKFI